MTAHAELWERVQRRFAHLTNAAEAFDPAAWHMVASLIQRASSLPDAPRARLAERALERMTAFERESLAAAGRARTAIDELHRRGGDADDALTAFEEGRFKDALRLARGALFDADHAKDPRARAWLERMTKEARSRGARLPGALERDLQAMVEGRPSAPPPELSSALSATLFRQSAAAMRAVVTAARAAENVPETVGPYNAIVLSAKTLEELADLSPGYLRAFVQRIEALRTLQKLPDATPREPARQSRSGGTRAAPRTKKTAGKATIRTTARRGPKE